MIELALLGLTILGFLVLLDRRDQRTYREFEANRAERARLIVHIQAPEIAVATHASQEAQDPPPTFPPTDEEIIEMQERERALAEVTDYERRLM